MIWFPGSVNDMPLGFLRLVQLYLIFENGFWSINTTTALTARFVRFWSADFFKAVLEFPLYYVLLFTPGAMEVHDILTEMEHFK